MYKLIVSKEMDQIHSTTLFLNKFSRLQIEHKQHVHQQLTSDIDKRFSGMN